MLEIKVPEIRVTLDVSDRLEELLCKLGKTFGNSGGPTVEKAELMITAPVTPDVDVVPTHESVSGAAPEQKNYTLEQVRAAARAIMDVQEPEERKTRREAVKAILTELDAPGVTKLAPEKYATFMERLGEIDA